MNDKHSTHRNARLDSLTAELTVAAYQVALRSRTQETWLDLQLALWAALHERVTAWEPELRPSRTVRRPARPQRRDRLASRTKENEQRTRKA